MRYGHNKLTIRTQTLLLHPWLLTADVFLCKAVSEVLFADTWYWVGEGWTEVWNNEILFTMCTKTPRTHRTILQYDCLLKEWCIIKYILLSVITKVCSDLIFISENPVSLHSVEPKFTSSHIIFRNGKFFNKYDWRNTSFSYTYESETPQELLPTKRFKFSGTMFCND